MGAARGYKVMIVMPDTMSAERRKLMKAYGAELVLTDGKKGMKGAIEKARRTGERNSRFVYRGAVCESRESRSAQKDDAEEIWEDTDGAVDIFVAGVGTGGTVTGVGEVLKKKKSGVYVAAVEPAASPCFPKEKPVRIPFRASARVLYRKF